LVPFIITKVTPLAAEVANGGSFVPRDSCAPPGNVVKASTAAAAPPFSSFSEGGAVGLLCAVHLDELAALLSQPGFFLSR
jgi:hypothetical protein